MKLLILLGFFSVPMFAQTNIWHGYIGKSEIYCYLPCDVTKKIDKDNSCGYGSYFYRKFLQDIKLEEALPPTKNYKFNLQVKHSLDDNADAEEFFELNYKKGKLIGYWSQIGKKLSLKLTPYSSKSKNDDAEEVFTSLRREFLKFKRGKVQKFPKRKKELVWIEEEHTQSTMFRLGNGFSSSIRKKLNPVLDKSQEQDALFELTCGSRWSYGSGVESLVNEITYLSKDLLGYSNFSSYFCGGAHPDFGTTHYLVDLHTGKYYALSDIVKFQQNVPKSTDNWEERTKYSELVARKLRELAFKAEGMELKENEKLEEDGYDPYQLSHWEYMDWSYEKDGIRFFLDFCTAARCFRGDSYLIPFKLLSPYKNLDFSYAFKNTEAFMAQ